MYKLDLFAELMATAAVLLLVLVSLTALNQFGPQVDGKVITVNNDGDISIECCVNGTCPCGSLYYAFQNLTSNSIINVTSESVTLRTTTPIGSGNLHNITITGNGATIMCNNSGGVYCESCSDVIIEEITWDGCYTSRLLIRISSVVISNCSFCYTENDVDDVRYRFYGDQLISIQDSNFTACGSRVDYDITLTLSFETNRHFIIVISYSTFSIKLMISQQMIMPFSLIVLSCEFTKYSILSASVTASQATFLINDTNFQTGHHLDGFGYGFFLNNVLVPTTEISISNSKFVNYSNPALFINSLIGNNSSISLNNVSFIGNKGRSLHGCVRISAEIDNNFNITFFNTTFMSNNYSNIGYGIVYIFNIASTVGDSSFDSKFTRCIWKNNIAGGSNLILEIRMCRTFNVDFSQCEFVNNTGSAIHIAPTQIRRGISCNFLQCTFVNNTSTGHGAALYVSTENTISDIDVPYTQLIICECNFEYNFGGRSIVYVVDTLKQVNPELILSSTNFTNNIGSALLISSTVLYLQPQNLFVNNIADNGAAIYFNENSYLILDVNSSSLAKFIGNTVRFRGGAVYVDFTPDSFSCNPVLFVRTVDVAAISFDSNSAGIAGNDIYFNFIESCDEDFTLPILNIISRFNYTQTNGAIDSSPLKVNLCSRDSCDLINDSCSVDRPNMLGHPISFSTTVCDYFNNPSRETVQVFISCVDCNSTYRLQNSEVCLRNGNEMITVTGVNATERNHDDDFSLLLNMISIPSPQFKVITAMLSVKLSPCFSGYVFNPSSQICDCYNNDDDVIQCNGDNAEISQGYWFGSVLGKRTVSLCPNFYCDFSHRNETGNGYYSLPRELDDQCRLHRTGVACGDCSSGYTLAYNAPDCVDERKCSWMLPLVIVLTILYWIIIVIGVAFLTHSKFQISLGHLYGIIYYYSIVDVLLGNDLYISDGVFQLVAVISSFAKLTPQIIGKLCFVKELSGIDQQFINYIQVIAVSLLLFGISRAAKYSRRIANFGQRFIVRAVCVLLLLSYTSLASTSLQLLRPLKFNDVDGTFSYSSPDVKYFSGRHVVYGIVAILCVVVFVIGLPFLLVLEPFLRSSFNFVRIKPLLDQFQGSYKDKYRWFAAYYLICRLVIFIISYAVNNYQDRLYCLQTACIVIVLIHGWIQPYKYKYLNTLDSAILVIIVLVVNLTTFNYSQSTTIGISVVLILLPLCVVFMSLAIELFIPKMLRRQKKYCIDARQIHRNNNGHLFER